MPARSPASTEGVPDARRVLRGQTLASRGGQPFEQTRSAANERSRPRLPTNVLRRFQQWVPLLRSRRWPSVAPVCKPYGLRMSSPWIPPGRCRAPPDTSSSCSASNSSAA